MTHNEAAWRLRLGGSVRIRNPKRALEDTVRMVQQPGGWQLVGSLGASWETLDLEHLLEAVFKHWEPVDD